MRGFRIRTESAVTGVKDDRPVLLNFIKVLVVNCHLLVILSFLPQSSRQSVYHDPEHLPAIVLPILHT